MKSPTYKKSSSNQKKSSSNEKKSYSSRKKSYSVGKKSYSNDKVQGTYNQLGQAALPRSLPPLQVWGINQAFQSINIGKKPKQPIANVYCEITSFTCCNAMWPFLREKMDTSFTNMRQLNDKYFCQKRAAMHCLTNKNSSSCRGSPPWAKGWTYLYIVSSKNSEFREI